MVVVVDGMGGDFCPNAVVEGCIAAIKEYNIEILITGSEELIREELKKHTYDTNKIKIINTTEVIDVGEHPVMAVKRKKDSSLVKALNLVKNGEADAIISAGSTGAFLAGCTLIVGRIKGINRPALAPVMPGKKMPFMIIDCGANAECKPNYLLQFGLMGKIYFENILKVVNPSVGLVNIGSEEEKGNELSKATFKLLKEANLNFVGNVEAREIPTGDVNVLVCDGFTGNVILKLYEGTVATIFDLLKTNIMASVRTKIGGMLLKPVFKKFKKDFDYKEYGGAAFLGVNGICIKAHGSSDAKAFKNAIKQATIFYDNNVVDKLKLEIEKLTDEKA
ncbi:phosphate acyltransferase PlsX [Clostridium estertheticum]|uniref:Phosphate acyltransferase n=1 Tax=Clostridium estertheticum subsp. estertheticum TaxID=1552 RepID=A0A1J0GJ40_9CLOT|nr:phosphate acyltransferase PlsX [Clostridium estertheticum]APC40952.1 phosphate acyltransferase [Clostridium estertheticum subsp. estertheticum]MBU3074015.1 phosphate acyltransferase PlsX [Clostridium estertheticum]MBU3164109.1 phosphate acyltransferase PlsX [Clostridium estertheticum]MBU3170045.1 phosphate acyltransferase PlsX [Clostridium estertheticum]MBZ9617180.1 phosphate acyltransferase PlsX [Clostridium estertheticum subsp. laramiense]